jgi:acyl-CoA synthetase (AMP-forming)/AMP-acid ligase II
MIFGPDGSTRWEDPRCDGWFRTSDRAELRHGELRFLGRADDLVKIRGELVDIAALERGLQARIPSGLVRIDTEPDERNGARLVVVAENTRAESEARGADDLFPAYAKPSLFRVGPVELSPLGKKLRPAAPAH